VDGVGLRILRDGGLEVVEGICEGEVRHQLAPWILAQHAHEIARHAAAQAPGLSDAVRLAQLVERYGLSPLELQPFLHVQ
jgi:diaminohydroxyphosphoribosylaminopyrimidine deaminase/5-amino-6-(5-phosphoribosylamino)uracil reductase